MLFYIIYALAAGIIIAADRVSKLWAAQAQVGETIAELPLFNITYVQNKGAAFSLMSGRLGILSVISVLVCAAVIAYFIIKRPKNKLLCSSLALIFAGGLGNAWDRIAYGYVIDFIEADFINFPVFNVADIAITSGAALMILYALLSDAGKDKNRNRKMRDSNG